MDPIANLSEQRELSERILATMDQEPPWDSEEFGYDSDNWGDDQDRSEFYQNRADELGGMAARLAELVQALDHWRRQGGFDPYAGEPDICDECGAITPPGARSVQGRWHDSACSLRDDTVEP